VDADGNAVKLIINPSDGVTPILSAIKDAKKTIEIAIFRFDRKDIEAALKAAAARGVRVTALIASVNRGGEQNLRTLELRFLEAGIIVARTAHDLTRYHNKYMVIDERVLWVFSTNLTHLDIDHSRGFGISTTRAGWVGEARHLFHADCTRTKYVPKSDTFIVSPANARKSLGTFLQRAKKQLLIYDPKISDKEMLLILQARVKAGVEVRIIGSAVGRRGFDAQKLGGMRLHTRTIIRDRSHAFIGSQSLRAGELDSRRELGLVIQDAKAVKALIDTFESDWDPARSTKAQTDVESKGPAKEVPDKTVALLTKELNPIITTVKRAVRKAVAQGGEDVLHDEGVRNTMKKVVKKAMKDAVLQAVQEGRDAQ